MGQLLNDPSSVVFDMATGVTLAHPHLQQLGEYATIATTESPLERVAIVSGGGSGHEPAHWGYVGKGMLDAACAGQVFTSPPVEQILDAIHVLDRRNDHAGVLLVVKNFAGDVMNFGMAAETARNEGVPIAVVTVNDDVSISDPSSRRGVAGAVLLHKIAGAMAVRGAPLVEVKRTATRAVRNMASYGIATSPCVLPGAKGPSFELADDEMELGIGIHGERGTATVPLQRAGQMCELVFAALREQLPSLRSSRILLLVNGMGGTPSLELYLVFAEIHRLASGVGATVAIGLVGNFMTSLNMVGFSSTILLLDDELEELLRAEHHATAFPDLTRQQPSSQRAAFRQGCRDR